MRESLSTYTRAQARDHLPQVPAGICMYIESIYRESIYIESVYIYIEILYIYYILYYECSILYCILYNMCYVILCVFPAGMAFICICICMYVCMCIYICISSYFYYLSLLCLMISLMFFYDFSNISLIFVRCVLTSCPVARIYYIYIDNQFT